MSQYIRRHLAKVTSSKGVEYFAVSEKTLENMDNCSSSMTYIICNDNKEYNDAQFTVEDLGTILVEIDKDFESETPSIWAIKWDNNHSFIYSEDCFSSESAAQNYLSKNTRSKGTIVSLYQRKSN